MFLTVRQIECLEWVQAGKSSSDIGHILGVSNRTVDEHLAEACKRLQVRTRIQAVAVASELGLIAPSTQATASFGFLQAYPHLCAAPGAGRPRPLLR